MDDCLQALKERFQAEPFAQIFGIQIIELESGRVLVRMEPSKAMNNIFDSTHGAAIYALIDSAFELSVNSHGTVAVALSVNVNYLKGVVPGETLFAEGREIKRSSRISACEIRVTSASDDLIATCQALAYRKKDPLPFL